jgi:hypothetical protein
MRFVAHKVRSGASGVQNIDALFSCLGRPRRTPQEAHQEMLLQTYVFASDVIFGSCSVFGCVHVVKRRDGNP